MEKRARVVAVGNQKGGVAKTTIAVHLANGLAEMGYKCLVFDLDMNCGSTRHFGIPPDMPVLGTYEVLVGEESPHEVVITNGEIEGVQLPENLDLIAARRNLEAINTVLIEKHKFGNPNEVLKPVLDDLRGSYDFIFCDTAPNATIPTIAAYKSADYFLLSAVPESFAIDGLGTALQDIATVKSQGNPELKLIGVVLSSIGRTSRLQRELLDYVRDTFDKGDEFMRSYETSISRTTYISACQKEGSTMFQMHPSHKVTEQYRSLAKEFEYRIQKIEKSA
jgi:chromosome partitioning protein